MAKPLPTKSEFETMWADPDRSVRSIAREFFVTEHRVMAWAVKWGLVQRRHYQPVKFDRCEQLRALWANHDMSITDIAKTLKIGRTTVVRVASKLCLPARQQQIIAKGHQKKFEWGEGPRPGDPSPEEIARLAAECRRRREEVAHAV
jgi:hypothetical protein